MPGHFLDFRRSLLPAGAAALRHKATRALREGGLVNVLSKARVLWALSRQRPVPGEPDLDRRNYREWVRRYDTLTDERRSKLTLRLAELHRRPRITVLMPTYNPRREWLVEAIESVRAQIYPEWELCIADDASSKPHVREVLEHYQRLDPRIRVAYRAVNGHISATSNTALGLATGEWVALLDHDDLLPAHALLHVALAIDSHPQARLIYSDEDKLGPDGRFEPYFKSDWNIDLFHAQNMFSHLGVLHTALAREVGGFREGLEGSQDYDLALRCVERIRPEQVVHIPRVLYHWRVHEESTASSHDAKPYAQVAAVRALREHFERTGVDAQVAPSTAGYRTTYPLSHRTTRVALVMAPTEELSGRDLEKALHLLDQRRGASDVSLVLHGVRSPVFTHVRCISSVSDHDLVRAIDRQGCDVVCMLRSPLLFATDDWLDELVRQASRPDVGLSAPMLLGRRSTVESGGVILAPTNETGFFRGLDAHAGFPSSYSGHGGRAQLVQGLSAVRDVCVAMKTSVFRGVLEGGHLFHADGGLRLSQAVREMGLTVLWTPFSRVQVPRQALRPLGAISIGMCRDAFYNPNLYTGEADFTLAWPPLAHGDE